MQTLREFCQREPGHDVEAVSERRRYRLGAIIVAAFLGLMALQSITAMLLVLNGEDPRGVIDAFNPLTLALSSLAGAVVGHYFADRSRDT